MLLPGLLALCVTAVAKPVTPGDLAARLEQGEDLILIDLRPSFQYRKGSIPGAINIPGTIIEQKQLPPLGKVVAFYGGLGDGDAEAAAKILSGKPGIDADHLVGGFAGWQETSSDSTAKQGMREAITPMVTYQTLQDLEEPLLIVDVRSAKAKAKAKARAKDKKGRAPSDAVTELCNKKNMEYCGDLDGLRARNPNGGAAAGARSADRGPGPLVVLIDDDNKTAAEVCHRLAAEGYKRVVVLAGGEETVQLKGRRGLKRLGGSVSEGEVRD